MNLVQQPAEVTGRDPLVVADKPFGEWNSFRITMVGEQVTVVFNDKLVVDHDAAAYTPSGHGREFLQADEIRTATVRERPTWPLPNGRGTAILSSMTAWGITTRGNR